jgi:hypothetical protein
MVRTEKSIEKLYLNVPFMEKDVAKNLGARWDPQKKLWYAPSRYYFESKKHNWSSGC